MENFIINYFKKLNIEIDSKKAEQFITYKDMLVEWNKE